MANIVDELLKLDRAKLEELPTAEVPVKRLSELTEKEAKVTVRAIKGDRYMELAAIMVDKAGNPNYQKSYDAQALIVSEGMVDPDIRDEKLQKHFGCASSKELVKLLFPGGDLVNIAGKITELSGFDGDKNKEDEIKN